MGRFKFLNVPTPNPNYVFFPGNFKRFLDISPFQCYHWIQYTGYHPGDIMHSLKYFVNVQQTKFWQISKKFLILRVHEKVFHLLGRPFCKKFTSRLPSFDNWGAHFPVGKIIYWVCSYGQWTGWIYWMGKVIYYVGKYPPTQLTCYLPLPGDLEQAAGPHAARLARVARFDLLLCANAS